MGVAEAPSLFPAFGNGHGLTLIPAWISNCMPTKAWGEITYPFPILNGATVEVGKVISPHML